MDGGTIYFNFLLLVTDAHDVYVCIFMGRKYVIRRSDQITNKSFYTVGNEHESWMVASRREEFVYVCVFKYT